MTRNGSRKKVSADYWLGRLEQGRDFLEAAKQAMTLFEPGQNTNPIISQIVLAAIAYCDCLTAKRAGVVNTQDHGTAAKLLRDVLRESLPDAQETRIKRILGKKDEAQESGANHKSTKFHQGNFMNFLGVRGDLLVKVSLG